MSLIETFRQLPQTSIASPNASVEMPISEISYPNRQEETLFPSAEVIVFPGSAETLRNNALQAVERAYAVLHRRQNSQIEIADEHVQPQKGRVKKTKTTWALTEERIHSQRQDLAAMNRGLWGLNVLKDAGDISGEERTKRRMPLIDEKHAITPAQFKARKEMRELRKKKSPPDSQVPIQKTAKRKPNETPQTNIVVFRNTKKEELSAVRDQLATLNRLRRDKAISRQYFTRQHQALVTKLRKLNSAK